MNCVWFFKLVIHIFRHLGLKTTNIQINKKIKQIIRRGRPRKCINKSPEINRKRKFTESEDESNSDPDYDNKQKPKVNKKKKHFKENEDEELNEGINFETNPDFSSEDEKEEMQENFQNVEHGNKNEQPHILDMENSKKRLPPELRPDQLSTSGLPRTQNIIECRDQLTIWKDNYAYFVTNKGEPRDLGSKSLKKCGKLLKLKNLQKGILKELRKKPQYHFALPIEDESKTILGETTKDIK